MKHIKKFNESAEEQGLTRDDAEQLFGEIDNQGFDYWLTNYSDAYFRSADGKDEELERLCKEACDAINKADNAVKRVFKKYDIY